MASSRYSISRQKACQRCVQAKARCDRSSTGCGRCSARGLECSLACDSIPSPSSLIAESREIPTAEVTFHATHEVADLREAQSSAERLDFSDLDLACPIDAAAICNRWLNPYLSLPGQPSKTYPAPVRSLIATTLKAYTSQVVHGRGIPSFIHHTQQLFKTDDSPLRTCLALSKMCGDPATTSRIIASEMLEREMQRLYESRHAFSQLYLLESFQALTLYAMIFMFKIQPYTNDLLQDAMRKLQEVASLVCQSGIVCSAELQHVHTRPRWEDWIIVEARRRTLYVMYLFDSLLSARDGLPTFLGIELRGLPGPSSGRLWQSPTRKAWEGMYNTHLAAWPAEGLRIDELWPTPDGFSDDEVNTRTQRIEHWLEDVDEYGMMIYAVTSYTHGTAPG